MDNLHIRKKAPAIITMLLLALFSYLMYQSPQLQAQESSPTLQQNNQALTAVMQAFLEDQQPVQDLAALSATPCVGNDAGGYPCHNVDLLAFMPLAAIGGGSGSDIWGWTDPLNGKEYALMGRSNGTAFVDISDPENPTYLGNLASHTGVTTWRDVKVYANHAFIVSDNNDNHGMQIFDLTNLRTVVSPPVAFSETAHYAGFGSAHNIVINEKSGFAYGVGADCAGGLHAVDIRTPTSPAFAGCFSGDGYTHDAQCVIYNGPDLAHIGKEVCFNANADTVTIVDMSDKGNPLQLSRSTYAGSRYTHQAWLTEDQTVLLVNDELDEYYNGTPTRTFIWDVSNLDDPSLINFYTGPTTAIDHNLYTRGNLVFESNYRAGLRILDGSDAINGNLSEVGYFDVYPSSNSATFSGMWSNYPYFDSDNVVVSTLGEGLFILDPHMPPDFRMEATAVTLDICDAGSATTTLDLDSLYGHDSAVTMSVNGVPAGATSIFSNNPLTPTNSTTLTVTNTTAALGDHLLQVKATDGMITATEYLKLNIAAAPTAVADLSITKNINNSDVDLSWTSTGADYYDIWRSDNDPYFTPGPDCSAAANCTTVTTNSHTAIGDIGEEANNYSYLVVARNKCGATTASSNLTGEFDFALTVGLP